MTLDTKNNFFSNMAKQCFSVIAPTWPLQNLIAVNPLQGLEDLPIEEALKIAEAFFEVTHLPAGMELANIQMIKWLQLYSDEGQATLTMPTQKKSFYLAWRELAVFDTQLHQHSENKKSLLASLPENPADAIEKYLTLLNIDQQDYQRFLTLLLTTLPGWASLVKYKTEWTTNEWSQLDYLAVRIIITYLMWPQAKELLDWHQACLTNTSSEKLTKIQKTEDNYRTSLLQQLVAQKISAPYTPEAQFVFCIDVRSEPFRRALESVGDYQTFGFAGFFGIPAAIFNKTTGESYASCPVLLQPKHQITESYCSTAKLARDLRGYRLIVFFKKFYQSLKYNFTTPFSLVEALGLFSGLWMAIKSLSPNFGMRIKKLLNYVMRPKTYFELDITGISMEEQCRYAESALKIMGLTHHFAPIIVLCGHGSHTENNAYATALDCGACGGRHGGSNAKILAAILNSKEVRLYLLRKNIDIPESTQFIAAEHNTTTDDVVLYATTRSSNIDKLTIAVEKARRLNNDFRLKKLGVVYRGPQQTTQRSYDWAQVRPEWGLTGNAAFIIAPRELTHAIDLDGRCFLHSYDYLQDLDGASLTTILTAPMVVAQWINMQYFFSTMNNVAYGGGSKITKNITGKIGIMQGNASDLMTGLPLQSLYYEDTHPAHVLQRLQVIVLTPQQLLDAIIQTQPVLQRLLGNGWVRLIMMNPDTRQTNLLNRDFSWSVDLLAHVITNYK